MKFKKYRDLIIFLVLIPIFLLSAFLISSRMENKLPAYSVINKASSGTSVFYESLKKLDIPVERTIKPVYTQPKDTVQIVVPGNFDINNDKIKNWVNAGGVVVQLSVQNIQIVNYDIKPDKVGNISIYNYGKGAVITADASYITNKKLMEGTNNAYDLLVEIGAFGDRKIYFNEAHLFASNKVSLWDYVPIWAKFMIYQLVLSLIAFFYYKGKRFGKPSILYEEEERSENEYLYSASSLYRQAKCYDLIIDNYYKKLLKDIKSTHEEWIEYWQDEELPHLNKAKKLQEFMGSSKTKINPKEYIQIVGIIENLNNIVRKRRESYWKVLKKIH